MYYDFASVIAGIGYWVRIFTRFFFVFTGMSKLAIVAILWNGGNLCVPRFYLLLTITFLSLLIE